MILLHVIIITKIIPIIILWRPFFGVGGRWALGWVGVRMLHIMLCIMLHVLDLLLRCRDKDFGLINFLPDKKNISTVFRLQDQWGPRIASKFRRENPGEA